MSPDGVHLEEIAGLLVQERIDRPHEPVVGQEVLVALHRIAEQAVRFRIEAEHAHVEPFAVEEDPHLGPFGRRPAIVRVLLDEVGGRNRAIPGLLVENAIERDPFAFLQPLGRHRPAVGR